MYNEFDLNTVVIIFLCYYRRATCINCKFLIYAIEIFNKWFRLQIWFDNNLNIGPGQLCATETKNNELFIWGLFEFNNLELAVSAYEMLLIDRCIVVIGELAIDKNHWLQHIRLKYFQVERKCSM